MDHPSHPATASLLAPELTSLDPVLSDLEQPLGSDDSLVESSELPIDSSIASNSASDPSKPGWREELAIGASTFITIFLAELGDKTQVTTLLMSAQSQAPWIVFAGASLALVTTSLIGVLVGRWLAKRVSAKTLDTSAGMLLIVLSALLFWDVLRG